MRLLGLIPLTATLMAGSLFSAQPAAADDYEIDLYHSAVIFKIGHLNVSQTVGLFQEFEGTISFDAENPEQSSVVSTVYPETVNSFNNARDGFIADVLGDEPWEFESTRVRITNADAGEGIIEGKLSYKELTANIIFNVTNFRVASKDGQKLLGFTAIANLSRQELNLPSSADKAIGNDVILELQIEATN